MKKLLPILILAFILLFSLACVLNRFARGGATATSASLPTYTPVNPSTSAVTQTTLPPPSTPTQTHPTVQVTTTIHPSASPSTPTLSSTPPGIGVSVDCNNLIDIEVLSAPSYYTVLNLLKANGKWLILHLQLTNPMGETYNYLHENDFTLVSSTPGKTIQVLSTQSADIEAYLVWAYASYLVDPLPGGGTSPRIVAFDVDPAIKDWTLVFTPKDSMYSTTSFCTVEISLH